MKDCLEEITKLLGISGEKNTSRSDLGNRSQESIQVTSRYLCLIIRI